MRILLVDPRDSPRRGPWSRQRWDLVIDLGRSSHWSADVWAKQFGCPVTRTDLYRGKIEDVRRAGEILSAGRGRLIDEEGIDWWELASLLLVQETIELVAWRRLVSAIPQSAEVWITRREGIVRVLEILLGRELLVFEEKGLERVVARAAHYSGLLRQFSTAQIREIFFDKYDADYRWRSAFSKRRPQAKQPVVLIPSAYKNVSRMAADYARLLPKQQFLMVAARSNAREFVVPSNVQVRDLAEYAGEQPTVAESKLFLDSWKKFDTEMRSFPDLQVLAQAGALNFIPEWIRDGLYVRNAWLEVLRREPIRAVLCGDDSNFYTRLPVLLAARRNITTLDFHHGALDGFHLVKDLPCDVYMAKNEMERDYQVRVCGLPSDRVVVAAPAPQHIRSLDKPERDTGAVVLFSEPYDVAGMRAEEVYREIMPSLCRLAREHGREVIIKLHPFESHTERDRLLREILAPEDYTLIQIVDGPLSAEFLSNTWVGVTVESTTVLDCLQQGVACFLCGWLTLAPYEYPEQYARFGVGEILESAEQIAGIPCRVEEFRSRAANEAALWATADPSMFEQWLTSGRERSDGALIS